jgi:hypothetical protein
VLRVNVLSIALVEPLRGKFYSLPPRAQRFNKKLTADCTDLHRFLLKNDDKLVTVPIIQLSYGRIDNSFGNFVYCKWPCLVVQRDGQRNKKGARGDKGKAKGEA